MKRTRRTRPDTLIWLTLVQQLRRALSLAGTVAVILAGAFTLWWLLDTPVGVISVEAPYQRVSALDVEKALQPFIGAGFLSLDLDDVRRATEALAWVDRARVRREWPRRLRIVITEQVAAARWGQDGLLNTRGELFVINAQHLPPELPQLHGPPGTEWRVAQRYLEVRGRLIEAGFALTGITLDNRGSWRLQLESGIEIRLGRERADQRLNRFVDLVAPLISSSKNEVLYIDMRYVNGFAIAWKDSTKNLALQTENLDSDV